MLNQVHILQVGYSSVDSEDNTCMRANCSCTLIRTRNGRNIIVDTMTAWDGERIVEALKSHKLKPDDINVVVCTHGHSDHTGCNYLFLKAEWHFVGASISHRDKYFDWNCADSGHFRLDESVVVERTPGHTLACVSVLVRDTQLGEVVGICGDLFERGEDIEDASIWLEAGSEDAKVQRQQRLRMAELCTYIIPGHGEGFAVTQEIRIKLRKDVMSNAAS